MNMFKKNGGFTLVELIVVIAILAILAGVAVPAYSGYINRANDAAVITSLDAVQTAAQAANATAGAISKIQVTAANAATVTSDANLASDFKTNFEMFYNGATVTVNGTSASIALTTPIAKFENSSYKTGATWTSTGWEAGLK